MQKFFHSQNLLAFFKKFLLLLSIKQFQRIRPFLGLTSPFGREMRICISGPIPFSLTSLISGRNGEWASFGSGVGGGGAPRLVASNQIQRAKGSDSQRARLFLECAARGKIRRIQDRTGPLCFDQLRKYGAAENKNRTKTNPF